MVGLFRSPPFFVKLLESFTLDVSLKYSKFVFCYVFQSGSHLLLIGEYIPFTFIKREIVFCSCKYNTFYTSIQRLQILGMWNYLINTEKKVKSYNLKKFISVSESWYKAGNKMLKYTNKWRNNTPYPNMGTIKANVNMVFQWLHK